MEGLQRTPGKEQGSEEKSQARRKLEPGVSSKDEWISCRARKSIGFSIATAVVVIMDSNNKNTSLCIFIASLFFFLVLCRRKKEGKGREGDMGFSPSLVSFVVMEVEAIKMSLWSH
ncbi:hypothetical protein DsansV1_C07g0070531 [Dioscorea sansibarensis]